MSPLRWYVGGSPRLEQIVVKAYDTFGVATYAEPEPAASTRAYAKIITDANQLDLKDLLRPQATEARR